MEDVESCESSSRHPRSPQELGMPAAANVMVQATTSCPVTDTAAKSFDNGFTSAARGDAFTVAIANCQVQERQPRLKQVENRRFEMPKG
jgi:hypothetical protein